MSSGVLGAHKSRHALVVVRCFECAGSCSAPSSTASRHRQTSDDQASEKTEKTGMEQERYDRN